MASGDVVAAIGGTGDLTFQPASGVEVCITWATAALTYAGLALTNGASTSQYLVIGDSSTIMHAPLHLFITNTVYLLIWGSNAIKGYSGVQIK